MSHNPYPEYRPSEVEWMDEVPADWATVPVKRRYAIQLGKMLQNNPESKDDVSTHYIKALHVQWGKIDTSDLPEMWANPADIRQFGVGKGDLLVCEGGEAGRAGIVDSLPDPCILQNALHRVRSKGADVRFLQYVLHAVGSAGWFDVLCNKATIAHFTREKLAELRIPLPQSLDEQCAIAAFLERETARIDALIEKKQRQSELLREKRAALVNRVCTSGILAANTSVVSEGNHPETGTLVRVGLPDRRIQWLFEAPEHWQLVPATWLFAEGKQRALDGDEQLSATQRYGVIPQVEFERLEGRQVVHAFLHLDQRKHVEVGDFVMSMRSFEGGLERVRVTGCVRSSYVVLRPSAQVHVGFFSYLFKSSAYIQALRATSNFIRDGQDLNYENFRLVKLPLVPLTEQEAIATFLDRETACIDALITEVHDSITMLREYRAALISAAVTGKIDVRTPGLREERA